MWAMSSREMGRVSEPRDVKKRYIKRVIEHPVTRCASIMRRVYVNAGCPNSHITTQYAD
jgi:hypothetical protein